MSKSQVLAYSVLAGGAYVTYRWGRQLGLAQASAVGGSGGAELFERARRPEALSEKSKGRKDEMVDEASQESFPASDPPSW